MMTETKLRKKLQELGIPSGGKKDILQRRHQEWVNIWNSNLDAPEDKRKSKRELLRLLDEWERTRGSRATIKEATIMRKDYDGKSHMETHKSEFDRLIEAARAKRQPRKTNNEEGSGAPEELAEAEAAGSTPDIGTDERPPQSGPANPYDGSEGALSLIREKVKETNLNGAVQPPHSQDEPQPSQSELQQQPVAAPTGLANPFASPSKRLPMFSLPEDPIIDVENGTGTEQ